VIAVLIIAGFFLFLAGMGIRAQLKRKSSGREGMIGEIGVARTTIDTNGGSVFIHGEYWNACSDAVVKKGSKVKVVEISNMVLKVEQDKAL
jgi:membrane-bound serine protease (ClpP class)